MRAICRRKQRQRGVLVRIELTEDALVHIGKIYNDPLPDMKVLWFSVTPSLYSNTKAGHNGGGWISSLEQTLKSTTGIELGVAFLHTDNTFKVVQDGVTYYPMPVYRNPMTKLRYRYFFKSEEHPEVESCLKVVDDFKPDVIHIFGTEWSFGLISQHVEIPVVIHIQGLANPYLNAYFPPGFGFIDFILQNSYHIQRTRRQVLEYLHFRYRAEREIRIFKSNRFFMGRTSWDKSIVKLLAPDSKYFYCSESLRPSFWERKIRWTYKMRSKRVFVSTISPPLYKGVDLILKTARILRTHSGIDFEWNVLGIKSSAMIERKVKILAQEVNVKYLGVVSEDALTDQLIGSDAFIHPSYIDNSPNSVCEAQLLGVPVISTDVGGISTLVCHEVTGLLTPANDPHLLAANILRLVENRELSTSISVESRKVAIERHNPQTIKDTLLEIYKAVVIDEKALERRY